MELMNKLKKEAMVLILQILDSQPSTSFAGAYAFPVQKALRSIAFVIAGPEEGATASIQLVNHHFWQEMR